MAYTKEEIKQPDLQQVMLQNHRAVSKYYKAVTWSVMSLHYIKETV